MSPVRRQGIAPRPFLRTLNVLWGSVDLSNLDKMDFGENEVRDLNLRSGDLLVCEGGDVGRTAIWRGELDSCLYQNHIHRLRRRNSGVAPEFYAYWMQAAFKVFHPYKGKEIATTIPNLSGGKLKSFLVPLPPTLAEQERIAGMLNEQIEAVDKARVAAEARLEAAKALPAAYLRAVFESEEAEGWAQRKFDEIAVLQRGYDLPFKNKVAGKYPLVTSSGIAGYHNEFKANAPGVVTGRSGSIGRVYYITEDYWPHNTSLFIRDFKGNVPLYIFYFLQWLNTEKVGSGTGVPTLDRKSVHRLTVGYPDIDTQNHIASTLSQRNAEALKIAKIIEKELETICALPAAFLRRAFTGGL